MMLSTDSDYTVDLAASAKSYKSCLQRLQKQNKSDTKPTPIQRIKLFSICKDFPSWLNIRLSAASINRPLPDPLSSLLSAVDQILIPGAGVNDELVHPALATVTR